MTIKRIIKLALQGLSFGLVLAICGCASQEQAAWVHPLAAQGESQIVAGDSIGLHVYTNAAAKPVEQPTSVVLTADTDALVHP